MKSWSLTVTFELVKEYPDEWDRDMVEFHCNQSSSCVTNLLEAKIAKDDCACAGSSVAAKELIDPR